MFGQYSENSYSRYGTRNDQRSTYGPCTMENSMVAHTWANPRGPDDYARSNNGNFYFEGQTIYSYGSHFPLATIFEKKGRFVLSNRQRFVLFNEDGYSVTTSQHKSLAYRATNHLESFEVANPNPQARADHRANFESLVKQSNENLDKASRARSNRPYLERAALSKLISANHYAKIFGFRWKVNAKQLSMLQGLDAERAEKQKEIDKKEQIALQKAFKTASPAFRAFLPLSAIEKQALWKLPALLRQHKTPTEGPGLIQTSQGAEFPTTDAIAAWPLLKRAHAKVLASGQIWRTNGHRIPLGSFHIDSITPQGLIAGCHKLDWPEVVRMARDLGLDVSEETLEGERA